MRPRAITYARTCLDIHNMYLVEECPRLFGEKAIVQFDNVTRREERSWKSPSVSLTIFRLKLRYDPFKSTSNVKKDVLA